MAPKSLLQERKFAEIAQRTREAVTLARRLRPAVAVDGAAGGGGILIGGAR
jgi:hypothetical protein